MKHLLKILAALTVISSCNGFGDDSEVPDQDSLSDFEKSYADAVQHNKTEDWLKSNHLDTAIIYHNFQGGQVDALHEYNIWWIKNGKINGSDGDSFEGFNILFKNLDEIKNEKPKELPIFSHGTYLKIKAIINQEEIVISDDGFDVTNCPKRNLIVTYLNGLKEKHKADRDTL